MNIVATEESLNVLRHVTEGHTLTYHEHTHVLFDVRTALGPGRRTYVEIGGFLGASAALMLNHPFETVVYTIDPMMLSASEFNGRSNQEAAFRKNISAANPRHYPFHLMKDYSSRALDKFGSIEIDILFIDGDHSCEVVLQDFFNYAPLVQAGGYVVFDDYRDKGCNPEVRIAVDAIVSNIPDDSFEIIDIVCHEKARPDIGGVSNEFILRKLRTDVDLGGRPARSQE